VAIQDPVAGSAAGAAAADREPTTGELVKGIVDDATKLVRQEVLLAKQELTEGAVAAAKASALLAAAAVFGVYGLGFLLFTVATAIGGPDWLGFLLVGAALVLAAGVLALLGRRQLAASKLAPKRAAAELRQTAAELREEIRRG
jgi:membrane protein